MDELLCFKYSKRKGPNLYRGFNIPTIQGFKLHQVALTSDSTSIFLSVSIFCEPHTLCIYIYNMYASVHLLEYYTIMYCNHRMRRKSQGEHTSTTSAQGRPDLDLWPLPIRHLNSPSGSALTLSWGIPQVLRGPRDLGVHDIMPLVSSLHSYIHSLPLQPTSTKSPGCWHHPLKVQHLKPIKIHRKCTRHLHQGA